MSTFAAISLPLTIAAAYHLIAWRYTRRDR